MTSLPAGYAIRPLSRSDAAALTDAMVRNREHLAPWSPRRSEAFFTLAGQQDELAQHLRSMDAGQLASYLIVREERIAGRINVQNIIRGAFHSAALGYWVDEDELNKGLASAAVAFACDRARELGLHRLEAGTLVHNTASQRVLRNNGFVHFGTAPDYLFIDGAWQEHNLYQRILRTDPLHLP